MYNISLVPGVKLYAYYVSVDLTCERVCVAGGNPQQWRMRCKWVYAYAA